MHARTDSLGESKTNADGMNNSLLSDIMIDSYEDQQIIHNGKNIHDNDDNLVDKSLQKFLFYFRDFARPIIDINYIKYIEINPSHIHNYLLMDYSLDCFKNYEFRKLLLNPSYKNHYDSITDATSLICNGDTVQRVNNNTYWLEGNTQYFHVRVIKCSLNTNTAINSNIDFKQLLFPDDYEQHSFNTTETAQCPDEVEYSKHNHINQHLLIHSRCLSPIISNRYLRYMRYFWKFFSSYSIFLSLIFDILLAFNVYYYFNETYFIISIILIVISMIICWFIGCCVMYHNHDIYQPLTPRIWYCFPGLSMIAVLSEYLNQSVGHITSVLLSTFLTYPE
eukprot:414534_1